MFGRNSKLYCMYKHAAKCRVLRIIFPIPRCRKCGCARISDKRLWFCSPHVYIHRRRKGGSLSLTLDFEIWYVWIAVLVEKCLSLNFKLIKWNFTAISSWNKSFWNPLQKTLLPSPLKKIHDAHDHVWAHSEVARTNLSKQVRLSNSGIDLYHYSRVERPEVDMTSCEDNRSSFCRTLVFHDAGQGLLHALNEVFPPLPQGHHAKPPFPDPHSHRDGEACQQQGGWHQRWKGESFF